VSDIPLELRLKARLQKGHILVPYLTAGIPSVAGFKELFAAVAPLADAIEVGIPFSDPMMDGPIIQAASARAIESGVTPETSLDLIREVQRQDGVPVVVMTYFNVVFRRGVERFISQAHASGVAGLIVPDLPFEESEQISGPLQERSMACIQMVAPTTPAVRAAMLAEASTGFVYAVSRLGVTGERSSLSSVAEQVVAKVHPFAKAPVLVGTGVSGAEHAREATRSADGVIVGSAVMRRALEGDIEGVVTLLEQIRAAM